MIMNIRNQTLILEIDEIDEVSPETNFVTDYDKKNRRRNAFSKISEIHILLPELNWKSAENNYKNLKKYFQMVQDITEKKHLVLQFYNCKIQNT